MMNQQRNCNVGTTNFRNAPNIIDGINQPMGIPSASVTSSPPLPPRRATNNLQNYSPYSSSYVGNGFGGYGSYGSNWGMNRYMGYGSYPGYSMYGQNQWGSLGSGDVENRFVQFAEESTRPAFQSIEAMVHTFSSVTMMLESTFFAMTSSFRAILGVAENMGKLRFILRKMLGSFALIRFFKWMYWKVKYMLGLRNQDASSEMLWRETIAEVMNGASPEQSGPSSWPIFLFLSILFAMPYLIHKLVNNAKNMEINVNNPKEWLQHKEPVFTATALYDFTPASAEELPLKTGQKVWLAPQSMQPKNLPGWWRATDTLNVGLIPSTYVTVVGQLKKKSETGQTMPTTSYQLPVVNEESSNENAESQLIRDFDNAKIAESKKEDLFKTNEEN